MVETSPGLHDVGRAGIGVAAVHQLRHPVEVNPLQRKAGQFPAVDQGDGGPQRRVAADRVDRVHGPGQREIGQIDAVGRAFLNHGHSAVVPNLR